MGISNLVVCINVDAMFRSCQKIMFFMREKCIDIDCHMVQERIDIHEDTSNLDLHTNWLMLLIKVLYRSQF